MSMRHVIPLSNNHHFCKPALQLDLYKHISNHSVLYGTLQKNLLSGH